MENKTITLTSEEFKEISTDAAAELASHFTHPMLPMVFALLCADIYRRLFKKEELTITTDEEE